MAEGKKDKVDMANFDWQKLEEEIRSDSTGKAYNETDKAKWDRKMANNPWVPIGTAVTTGILVMGLVSFATKRTKYSQLLMRARVAAQGFTIFALIGKYFLLCNRRKHLKECRRSTVHFDCIPLTLTYGFYSFVCFNLGFKSDYQVTFVRFMF